MPGGPDEPAWPAPGASGEHGRSYQVSASTLLPTSCHKAKPDPEGSAPSPLILRPVYIHRRKGCVYQDSNPLFVHRVRGRFVGHHHQAHLGHSLTPPPAAARGVPHSWRDPSHCAARHGAGGTPLPSAGLLSAALGRRPGKRASLLAASPSAPRPLQTCKPACLARYQRRAVSSVLGGGGCCPLGQIPPGSDPPELFAQVTRSSLQSLSSIVFTLPLKPL